MEQRKFNAVLSEHAGMLSRITSSYEANAAARDDLMQDIALALWKALPTWRGEAPLKAFVARVAHNRCATYVVGQMRNAGSVALSEQLVDHQHDPEEHAQLEQNRIRLQDAVLALPISLRQAVTLSLEGFSHLEIAEILGISTNNVSVRLNRAKDALMKNLGGAQ